MKVLHIETGRHVYGGPQQVLYLLRGLPAHGVHSELVCARNTSFADMAQADPRFGTHAIQINGDIDLPAIWRFRRIIERVEPDLVHIHSRRGADTLGALAARWAQVPIVLSRRVDNPESALALRFKYRLFQHVIAISDGIRDVLLEQGLSAEKVSCVRSAVDFEAFSGPTSANWRADFGLRPEQPVIGMLAQFIERKGHRFLLQAFAKIHKQHPGARVVLFGKGPLQDTVRQQIADLGLSEKIYLAGFREDLVQLLGDLYMVVHPATREGLGVSLLQSASAAVPVVASAAGGIPEAVDHERTGLLVAPGDVEELAAAMSKLLADPERAKALGRAGQQRMRQEFSPAAMVAGNVAVYEQVLAECGMPTRANRKTGSNDKASRGSLS